MLADFRPSSYYLSAWGGFLLQSFTVSVQGGNNYFLPFTDEKTGLERLNHFLKVTLLAKAEWGLKPQSLVSNWHDPCMDWIPWQLRSALRRRPTLLPAPQHLLTQPGSSGENQRPSLVQPTHLGPPRSLQPCSYV